MLLFSIFIIDKVFYITLDSSLLFITLLLLFSRLYYFLFSFILIEISIILYT